MLPATVKPGKLVDLSITLVAPAYQGDWRLQNPQSQLFGIGANRNGSYWVKIVVAKPSAGIGSISGFAWQDNVTYF